MKRLGSTALQHPALKQHEDYFRTDLAILNRGWITRASPETAPLSPNFRTTPSGRTFDHEVRFNVQQAHIHDGSLVELEPFDLEAETFLLGHRGSSQEVIT
ncbi:hypothetical protein AVEN_219464-1 [Araneus ventricosus]|uniref:Uncharacterized protein n=1 Tax=Araneus ventricosus TaxID=182803 RepID=A0A4Y2BM79_ARAVE|nr:hypothetical protein AVEN_219464-1 [Araneus ventricosus]